MAESARGAEIPAPIAPMLAVDAPLPANPDGYALEWKWDGFRGCLAIGPSGTIRITSRNGNNITARFPELRGVLAGALGGRAAVLDGELVALNERGRPEFGRMQRRTLRSPGDDLVRAVPVTFFAFDLLLLDTTSLLRTPYRRRRELLDGLDVHGDRGKVVIPPYYTGADTSPENMLRAAAEQGLEGVMAKRLDSPYLPGARSDRWIKRALTHTTEVVICGWRPGSGRRAGGIGSLLLGAHDRTGGELRYLGDVGTGFTERMLADLAARLAPLARSTSPFAGPVPRDRARDARWVEPELVGEVEFRQLTLDKETGERRLRHAAWRGLREDKTPAEVELDLLA